MNICKDFTEGESQTGDSAISLTGIVYMTALIDNCETIGYNYKRLMNQCWKILPMFEKEEDWQKQLESVKVEIEGLKVLIPSDENEILVLLSKLYGLDSCTEEFVVFRKTIFDIMNILGSLEKKYA